MVAGFKLSGERSWSPASPFPLLNGREWSRSGKNLGPTYAESQLRASSQKPSWPGERIMQGALCLKTPLLCTVPLTLALCYQVVVVGLNYCLPVLDYLCLGNPQLKSVGFHEWQRHPLNWSHWKDQGPYLSPVHRRPHVAW